MNMKIVWPATALIVSFSCWTGGFERGKRQANRETYYRAVYELMDTAEAHETNNYYASEVLDMFQRHAWPRLNDGQYWQEWVRKHHQKALHSPRSANIPAQIPEIFKEAYYDGYKEGTEVMAWYFEQDPKPGSVTAFLRMTNSWEKFYSTHGPHTSFIEIKPR